MANIIRLAALGALALAQFAAATPVDSVAPTVTKQCVQLQVTVPVNATNLHYEIPRVDSSIDAIDWTLNVTVYNTKNSSERVTGPYPVNRSFYVNAQLCVPSVKSPKSQILQIATQGLGYDKRYFDVEINPGEYSYLNAAIKKGYSVLTYDRLGTGKSEKPDAYDVVQIPTETEILAGLTKLARSGKLFSASKLLSAVTSNDPILTYKPTKVVHVGHSLGSFITFSFLVSYGKLSDGALLTGFLLSSKLGSIDVSRFNHDFAYQHDPVRFAEYKNKSGYIVLKTESDIQKLFFHKDSFEQQLLTYNNQIKQPETVGEYASEGTVGFLPAYDFTGPIQLMAGEYDYINCGGYCPGTYDSVNRRNPLWPNASDYFPYLQPNTGHGLTLSKNASAGYEVMLGYLNTHGL
ncbi:hypothetical protein B0H63DRAFT_386992 [Podospora didyma]|uniref:AB hydrolase-1 domain-containing protein n=1 Tax=Podospora didyma TaxID=330526 RepID=A0AAE0P8F8_9PEZI|nr:hypothetical protein B0H63DRAFT_386992 [Podospora didyma]